MIAIIRISGLVDMDAGEEETLFRLRIRRKYSCIVVKDSPEIKKVLNKIRNYVAYGTIDESTLEELIRVRGQPLDKTKKVDAKKEALKLKSGDLKDLQIKPFFRLHPPRGGIDSKKHFGSSSKAVLGDNKESINLLIRRML